jgi:predicted metal-binding protein
VKNNCGWQITESVNGVPIKPICIYFYGFCLFVFARGTGLKHERSEGFKASRAIRKTQFTQKRVAYKILLFETTSLKLPKSFKNGFTFAFDSFDKFFKTCQKCDVECVL